MKKNTSKNFSKRLLQYSALSVAALGVADATGQIIYTDVDPDAVLNVADTFSVDMNNDGLENQSISNPDGLAGGNAAIVFPSSGGAFVGFSAGGFQYPSLLADGDTIDAASGYTNDGVRGDLNYYGCAYSNSQWCNAVVDGYLGVRFDDLVNGTTHYGWIRMDTDVNGTNQIIVKDFAFNSVADEGILAGDDGILGIDDNTFNNFSFYVDANNTLNIKSDNQFESVAIYNIAGQEVIAQKLSSNESSININNLQQSVYIAKVSIEGKTKSFKIIRK